MTDETKPKPKPHPYFDVEDPFRVIPPHDCGSDTRPTDDPVREECRVCGRGWLLAFPRRNW